MQATFPRRASRPRFDPAGLLRGRGAPIVAGLSIVLIYAFSPVPLYLTAAAGLGVSDGTLQSGFFAAFASAGVVSIVLSLWTRAPIGFGWSAPALLYMVAAAPMHSPGELAGACLLAGLAMTAMAAVPWADALTRLAPMPVVMGVFAGSSIGYMTGAAGAAGAEPIFAGAPIAGYFLARTLRVAWLPPVAGALALGLVALATQGQLHPVAITPELPPVAPLVPEFSLAGAVTLALPLIVLSHGVLNLQAYAVLEQAGYPPPRRAILGLTGLLTMVHGLFAAPPAGMQKASLAIMTGEDSGTKDVRWLSAVVASIGAIAIAFCATSIAAFVAGLPAAFVVALMGVVLLPIVVDATRSAFTAEAGMAGALAFFVAASDFELWGISAAFWGLVVGVAAVRVRR